jgi:hypothetical protein
MELHHDAIDATRAHHYSPATFVSTEYALIVAKLARSVVTNIAGRAPLSSKGHGFICLTYKVHFF